MAWKKLLASDGEMEHYSIQRGWLDGNTVLSAAYEDDTAGSAYIYKRVRGHGRKFKSCTSAAQLPASFGRSVDISGNYIIIGDYTANSSMAVLHLLL